LKILVTGTYSSGKTSFCHKLLRACERQGWKTRCPIEVARSVELPLNTKQDGEASSFLIGMQMAMERELVSLCDVLICDRGMPDIWSHNLMSASKGSGVKNLGIKSISREWSSSYDIVIQSICNYKIEIPLDGFRVGDKTYRKKLELFHREAMIDLSMAPTFSFDHTKNSVETAIKRTVCYLRARTESRIS